MPEVFVPLYCVHNNQCDRKKCTALRLAHLNKLTIRTRLNQISPHAIVLDPFAPQSFSRADRETLLHYGLVVIDCSWEFADQVFSKPFPNGRRLPPLLAANSVNYGRWNKLSSAEALAAGLKLAGFDDQARELLDVFGWGPAFFEINDANWEKNEN
jgi:pre-rRNA-processing protein TSR3